MQFPKVSLGSFCTDFGATIHCLTLSQRDVALRRGVHVQSLRMHPRAVKKGSEVPPYLPSQSLRAVKELLPLSPYLLGYIRSRLSSLRSYSGPDLCFLVFKGCCSGHPPSLTPFSSLTLGVKVFKVADHPTHPPPLRHPPGPPPPGWVSAIFFQVSKRPKRSKKWILGKIGGFF